MTFQTNVVPHSDHTATKHWSVRLLLQNVVWTTMLIPVNAVSENQKVVRFVDKNYTKINRLCQFFVGKSCLQCSEGRTKFTDLITVLTFFSSKVDLSNIHILFVLVLSLPRFQIQYSNQNLAVARKVMRLRLATLTVGKKRRVVKRCSLLAGL